MIFVMLAFGGEVMTAVIIIAIIIFIIIFTLSIFTINKGYAFKHTIDERPPENKEKTHRHNG